MQKNSYTIRTMARQELDIALDWAAEEGWNPGLYDADCFYAADPDGFLVGLLDDEPIATISVVKYGSSFGFLGLYIVKPEYRGKGYGMQIWDAGLALLSGRTIGLDGVLAQQDNYKKSGFTLAYSNVRYQGAGGGHYPAASGIAPLSALAFDDICAYDQAFFPGNRREFLKCWIAQPQSTALGILRDNKLAGYGVLRSCRSGYKVGPLFADSPEYAEQLFLALKSHAPENAQVFLDIPAINAAAVDLVKRHQMVVSFETARMYTGQSPDLPINRLFGVTTFELG
ncbi:acetyltransferase (GNAT) family protein [Methylobacter tundripaludum]|uniref:Acetyltransferase (GNAT) family protein n=1 Tax=Methylobacter tundripaludum TaxID=173365 RepID=A0A2S6H7B2_9GAMM|nr:GNAT family N-acetyltransferase [Methylobacter tundripaludum]PPK73303.1 acetyltransferase (GNAT) family protein [Methylobacter tundripaludum]